MCSKDYILPIKGMSVGRHDFKFSIDNEFFKIIENSLVKDARLEIVLNVDKKNTHILLEMDANGFVETECDRCLDSISFPVDIKGKLLVKFVRSCEEEETDEVMILDPSEAELDLSQFIYDYVCLSLPIYKTHPQGECNKEMESKLSGYMIGKTQADSLEKKTPFDKLKDIVN